MIMEEIVKESPVLQEIMQEYAAQAHEKGTQSGMRRGIRQGRVEGRVDQAHDMLRSCLADRFPELAAMPEIGRLNAEQSKTVLLEVIRAKTAKPAREIIRRAARG